MMHPVKTRWPYNTSQWARLRLLKLSYHPVCYSCELRGRVVVADTVDHVTPISAGGDPFPALDDLMSLCKSCHSQKTQAVDRQDRWGNGRRFGGIDMDGNPVDPLDNWHGEGRVRNTKDADSRAVCYMQKDLFSDTYDKEGF